MAAHTAERRPFGALGRMGVVAAHARRPCSIVIARSLGSCRRFRQPEPMATFIDEAPPDDEAIPQRDPYVPPHQDTVFVPDRTVAPAGVRTGRDHGPAARDHRTVLSRRPAAPSRSRSSSACARTRVTRCRSRRIRRATIRDGNTGHGRHRGLRAAERPRRRRTRRQEHGIRTTGSRGAGRGQAQLATDAGDARRRAVRAVASPARDLQAESAALDGEGYCGAGSAGAACSAGGSRCWHSRSRRTR